MAITATISLDLEGITPEQRDQFYDSLKSNGAAEGRTENYWYLTLPILELADEADAMKWHAECLNVLQEAAHAAGIDMDKNVIHDITIGSYFPGKRKKNKPAVDIAKVWQLLAEQKKRKASIAAAFRLAEIPRRPGF